MRKGFLYGYKGFIVALLNAEGAFYRYAKLYELQKDYEFYKNAFFQKATKCVQNITKQKRIEVEE